MLRALLRVQLMQIFRAYFYDQKKNTMRSKAGIAAYIFLFVLLLVGVMGGMFTLLSVMLCDTLVTAGLAWLYFTVMGLLAILLGTFGSVFNTYASVYLAKDNDLLLAMPIPVHTVIAARLLGVYLMGLMYSATVMLPAVAVYLIVTPFSAVSLLCSLMFTALISVAVLILSCACGFAVAKISQRLKNKSFAVVLLSLLFVGAYYFVYYKAQSLLAAFLQNAAVYGERIKGAAYPLYLFGAAAVGNFGALAALLAVTAAALCLVWLLLSRSFMGIATAADIPVRRAYKAVRTKQRGRDAALLRKELLRFTASPTYMLNCGMAILLLPAFGVLLLLQGKDTLAALQALFPARSDATAVLLCAVIGLLASMNDTVAPSVSLEGRTLWQLQSLPVTPWQVLRAKLRLQLLLTVPPTLLCWGCTLFVYPYTCGEAVLSFVLVLLFVLLSALFGLFLGLRLANLNWTSEITPIKQGAAVALTLFAGWGYALLLGGLYFLTADFLHAVGYMLCACVITLLLCACLLSWLKKRGVRLFAAL